MDLWRNNRTDDKDHICRTAMTMKVANIAVHMLGFFFAVFLCNGLHMLLRPLYQPRIVSESIVGLFLSNISLIRNRLNPDVVDNLNYIVDVGMVCHMFVVGLEIDPNIFLQIPLREAKVACSAVLTTFVLASLLVPLLKIPIAENVTFNICLSIMLSGTASPLLTRLITDLKIGKSDIGRFVVSAGVHSDVISTFLVTVGYSVFNPAVKFRLRALDEIVIKSFGLVIETVLAARLTPTLMNWVNQENPEGKPFKGSHLVLSVAYVWMICSLSPLFVNYNKVLSAFFVGVFMPREGRISKLLISKVNYIFSTIFYPIFFFWVGTEAALSEFEASKPLSWATLISLYLIGSVGKVIGSLASGVLLGFHWPESIAIGLFLSIKGHFHVYLAICALKLQLISVSSTIAIVIVILSTIIYKPFVVAKIIERARKRSPTQQMALQLLGPSNELRILLCIRGPENVSAAINFMEISRGPANPAIIFYLTDMIELTDKVAATLSHSEGAEAVTVTEPAVVEMRKQITDAVDDYTNEAEEGITVRRMLALSTINNLHQDISILSQDLMVSLIVLPFHKNQEADGRLGMGHPGYRHVNRKVLRHAPCSVGILVDRGLGSTRISKMSTPLNAAVIFIGGKDDREALAYAGRVAQHPGVKLTVIRFLLELNGDSVTSKISRGKINTAEHEAEMKFDDECFAEFYDRHVAGGRVAYMEKYLVNSGQTFSTLRSLEGQYSLFIVGRAGRVNSVLTVGMNDWEECPELGPIGDILSASEFSITDSVLIIQQHSPKGELDGLHDEFSIM